MRLVFHDCMRYQDGTGGCDGCINFKVHFEENRKQIKVQIQIYCEGS